MDYGLWLSVRNGLSHLLPTKTSEELKTKRRPLSSPVRRGQVDFCTSSVVALMTYPSFKFEQTNIKLVV